MIFDSALNNGRIELHIPTNTSVDPQDIPRLSNQAKKIYVMLKAGLVTTSELAAVGLQYNARLSEVRHFLVKDGLMVDEIKGSGGENTYQIVKLSESSFWRKVKDRGECWKWL